MRRHLGSRALAAVVLLVGLALTAACYAGLRLDQRQNAARVMDQRTAMAKAAVVTETERYRSLVEAAAAGIAIDPEFTWEDFDVATAPLDRADLIGGASVAYVVPSTTAGIPALQSRWRARGADGLVLRPVDGAGAHYFSIFTRPMNGAGSPLNGLDVAGSPEAAAALDQARSISRPTVSDTYVLLRDRALPAAEQQLSFIFAAPVWTRANRPDFLGWLVLGLRGQDFLNGVLATVSQGQLDAGLLVTDLDGARPEVADYRVPGHADLSRETTFPVADREWTLVTRADSGRLPGARSSLPLTVLGAGIAITVILAGLVHVLATGRTRARQQVQEATAHLREAEQESRRQAGLLGAIMNSLGDGVGVVDADGAFLLHNPAAKQLLGISADENDPGEWQEHYGLYLPDGRTPFPVEDLPLIRALRGESPDNVEMVVRNANRPEGILLSVDGRPLDPSAGQVGAVAVFHDITDLRRYENDLAIFAGVVAHDLKAPLAVIRGYCEAAAEDLDDLPVAPGTAGPQMAEVRQTLGRAIRTVDRMAGLIDTLLAYSTARDAPLRTGPVDLNALIAEVIHDRMAHVREADRPDVHAGPLPEVEADPAMLRHVLDNVIGNAVKYVRAGTTARVDITGIELPGGHVRVDVADRGIGIPDRDKANVFESFHRAESAAGYAGTGLGLAICKRIVERHGGEIGVEDNPGGGTRLYFTLRTKGTSEMTDDDAVDRARLERLLAERTAMENSRLPGLSALPAADPSAHEEAAARLRAPVPDHHPTGAGPAD